MTRMSKTLVVGCLCLTIIPLLPVTSRADNTAVAESGVHARAQGVYVKLRIPLGAEPLADIPVALVNDEPITLGELTRELASMHAEIEPGTSPTRIAYTRVLDRLVATRLILLEAENIGLQERYGIQAQIDDYAEKRLLDQLMASAVKDVRPDEKEVETLYHKLAQVVKMDVLRLTDAAGAKRFDQEIAEGRAFPEIAQRLVDAGQGKLEVGSSFLKLKDLRQEIAAAIVGMEVGAVSPVFQDESGLFAFRLDDSRFEEDPNVKAEATRIVLENAKKEAGRRYADSLRHKHAKVNEHLLESLDFEVEQTGLFGLGKTQPVDYQKLRSDPRVLATISGPEPATITVGDLARAVEAKLYHGAEKAATSGKLNERKNRTFKNMLFKLVARREAIEQGIDQSDAFIAAVEEYKRSLLFGAFIRKVVAPEVTLSEEEVRGYYDAHKSDYATPTMVKLRSLVFESRANAEEAVAKLRKGTDFTWVSANVPGQVDKDAQGLLALDNRLLTTNSLPEGIRNLVSGSRSGDIVLYASPDGYSYVLVVHQMVPAAPQPYENVRAEISKIVFNDKLKLATDGWVEKLKEAYDARIFVTGFDL